MEKHFCKNCGNELLDGAEFCDSCGVRTKSTSEIGGEWYQDKIKTTVNHAFKEINKLPRTTLFALSIGTVIIIIIFLSISSQHAIERQIESTQSQLSIIEASTSQQLSQQAQEIDQKSAQISKLEKDIKTSTDSGQSGGMSGSLVILSPSVVKIVCQSDVYGNNLQEGSGVLYHSASSKYGPYYVETNLHVIQTNDGSTPQCAFAIYPDYTDTYNDIIFDVSNYQTYKSSVDLAFLTPSISNSDDAGTWSDLAKYSKQITSSTYCSTSSIGDHISILGYPSVGGSSLTATDGIISGFEYDDGVRFIKTSAKIEHGNSGGVAIEDSGCVLGIPTFVEEGEAESIGRILDLNDLFNN